MTGSSIGSGVLAALVDSRTGVVRRLERRPVPAYLPRSYVMIRSLICDSTQFCDWASDTAGAGYAFGDDDRALAASVGEAIERYCANLPSADLRRCRYVDLDEPALDPRDLALFSPDQYAEPGFPFAPLAIDTPVEWAAGRSMADARPVAVPAPLVWPGHHRLNAGRPFTPVLQAGLAAGPTREIAERHALAEVLERDAMTLSWTGRAGLYAVRPPDWVARLAVGPQQRLRARYLAFRSPFGLPVRGVLLDDPQTGRLCLGTAARPDPVDALVKALGEAFQLLLLLDEYDDPDGPFAAAARHPGSPLSPWRADRAYLAERRADLRDVVDYGVHLQLALDPAYRERFERELAEALDLGPEDRPSHDDGPVSEPDVVERLAVAGHPPVSVDVTTPDVAAAGLCVVRVVVPGLYGNAAAGLPFLGGRRMRQALGDRPPRRLPLPH